MEDIMKKHEEKIRSSLTHGGRIGKLELIARHDPNDKKAAQIAATKMIKEYVKASEDMFMWGEPQCAMLLVNNKTYVLSNIVVRKGVDSALFLAYPEGMEEN